MKPPTACRPDEREPELLKISQLSRESGVSAGTIKHYLREGLLRSAVRTHRNMAYYDPDLVPRIRLIKDLQQRRFLPLRVIKEMLDEPERMTAQTTTADALEQVLQGSASSDRRTRDDILRAGYPEGELDWLEQHGLVKARGDGRSAAYAGDDLSLLETLHEARRAGLGPEMLPLETLAEYAEALRGLVRRELEMFSAGVLPRAGAELPALAGVAARLSERLVVLMRRKLLLPTMAELMGARRGPTAGAAIAVRRLPANAKRKASAGGSAQPLRAATAKASASGRHGPRKSAASARTRRA